MEIELTKNTKLSVLYEAFASGRKCKLIVEKPVETVENFWTEIKHFEKSEFACKCGGRYCDGFPAEPAQQLVQFMDTLREYAGTPIVISSGVRCKNHNKNVGGVGNSYHMTGGACDFSISGRSAQTAINMVYSLGLKPIELYAIDDSYVHIAF